MRAGKSRALGPVRAWARPPPDQGEARGRQGHCRHGAHVYGVSDHTRKHDALFMGATTLCEPHPEATLAERIERERHPASEG